MKFDSTLVDYNSAAFAAGFAAGERGEPDTPVPDAFAADQISFSSWLEGWLMGDTEKGFKR